MYFETGVLMQGLERTRKDHDFKRAVVDHLAENKMTSSMERLMKLAEEQAKINEALVGWVERQVSKKGGVAYVVNPPDPLDLAANLARGLTDSPVGIAAEERGDLYVMSLRSVQVDLNQFLRDFSRCCSVSGGGHKNAVGARIPKRLFDVLVEELTWCISRLRWGPASSR
ncbi:DHH family phosphoesterase [Pyrobaculum sp.]|uniref:DHH family phosphoesterase n=1 Tax=Pyrobaculum sp. TaxID=2004705 RepID=UPI003164CDA0